MSNPGTLFDGLYKDLWRKIVPEALTQVELEFILQVTGLEPGDTVLDLMCGYGRHTLGLAQKGLRLTAVDSAPEYIEEIRQAAGTSLPVTALAAKVEDLDPGQPFDAVICMGNSISSLNKEQTLILFRKVAQCLHPGSVFVLNTWMLTEIISHKIKEHEWFHIGEYKYLLENKFHLFPTRLETTHTIITRDGQIEEKHDTDFIFSIAEFSNMLEQSGLKLKQVFSTPRKRPFNLGDEYAYLVAVKNS